MPNLLKTKLVFEFATDVNVQDYLNKIVEHFQLSVESLSEIQRSLYAILDGSIDVSTLPSVLSVSLQTDESKAKLISADLAGYYLLPLSLYIGGIKNKIIEWGGDPESYPKIIVEKEKIHPEELILELAKKIGLQLPEPMMKRFVYLGRGFLTGERDREATMLLFKRPINIGGLELTDDQTLKCLDLLSVEKSKFEVVEMEIGVDATPTKSASPLGRDLSRPVAPPMMFSQEKIDEMLAMPDFNLASPRPRLVSPSSSPITGGESPKLINSVATPPVMEGKGEERMAMVKAVTHALAKEVPVISGEMMAPHEQKDVEVATRKIAKQQIVPIIDKKKTEAEVNALLVTVIVTFKAKGLTKQDFTEVAQAHIKGLREAHQTERLLIEKFNFTPSETETIMKTLETARKIANSAVGADPGIGPVTTSSSTAPAESVALDLKHASLTGQMPKETVEPLMPTARVSAARTKDEEVAGQVAKIDETKIKDAMTASKPEKATAMISAASAPLSSVTNGPITDVKFAPHLTGPVEELGNMTPEQFRRLSSDPMEAMAKIFDKLSLLQSLSYSDRVRGIEAWRVSPMSHLYLQMAGEALRQGVAIAEISTRRRNVGQDSLSPVEIKAVMELNKRIKF